jgi:outer membrane lipoprotein-sorting protein
MNKAVSSKKSLPWCIKSILVASFIILSGINGTYGAQVDADAILKRAYTVQNQISYAGRQRTTLYSSTSHISADVKVLRRGHSSRLEYLTGPATGTIIIDDGKTITYLNPRTKTATVVRTPEPSENLSLLLRNYRPELIGSSTLAQRPCYIIRLTSKYPGNPYKKLWIDKSNFLPLRTDRYNSDGRLAISTYFTSIDFSAEPTQSLFTIPKGWKVLKVSGQPDQENASAVSRIVGFSLVEPTYLPRGYVRDGYFVCEACPRTCCAGIRYSNGLNVISVFERKIQSPGMGRGWRRGRSGERCTNTCITSQNPQGKMVQTNVDNLSVVIVGDIALSELQKIASSLK